MDAESWIQLAVVVISLMLVAFAATAETVLSSVSRARLHRMASEGVSRAKALSSLFEQPGIYLSTVVIVRTAAIILASGLTTVIALRHFASGIAVAAVMVGVFLVVVLLCQLMPKAFTASKPERVSLTIAGPLCMITTIIRPLIQALAITTNAILRLFGISVNPLAPLITEDELRMMMQVGEEEGIIEENEREMIHGIFQLEETPAREIMVPRIDIFALDASAHVAEAVEVIIRESYSRVPVYQGNIDNIIGILYAKDLFKLIRDGEWQKEVREVVRPAYFIPESKRIDELLHELQQTHVHIAIVVDEYGGTAGLVTIEDLLEEIVGEIQDEYDVEEARVERLSDTEAVFDGTVSIGDVNETLSINIDTEVDSIGGFVYDQLGRIPVTGDQVRINGVGVEVLATQGRRVKKVRVAVTPSHPWAEVAEQD